MARPRRLGSDVRGGTAQRNLSGVPRLNLVQPVHALSKDRENERSGECFAGRCGDAVLKQRNAIGTWGRHAHLAPERGGPCDRGPGTQGRVLRAMIETNRAELWAVSVAIDGFASFGVLARPVRDFLDVFQV